jgi:hypothetical protein
MRRSACFPVPANWFRFRREQRESGGAQNAPDDAVFDLAGLREVLVHAAREDPLVLHPRELELDSALSTSTADAQAAHFRAVALAVDAEELAWRGRRQAEYDAPVQAAEAGVDAVPGLQMLDEWDESLDLGLEEFEIEEKQHRMIEEFRDRTRTGNSKGLDTAQYNYALQVLEDNQWCLQDALAWHFHEDGASCICLYMPSSCMHMRVTRPSS